MDQFDLAFVMRFKGLTQNGLAVITFGKGTPNERDNALPRDQISNLRQSKFWKKMYDDWVIRKSVEKAFTDAGYALNMGATPTLSGVRTGVQSAPVPAI